VPVINCLYEQFIKSLRGIIPVQVVTTNVDLCLEQQLGPIDVIERTDLERCFPCVLAGSPFVAKLHGSISSVKSTVFTSDDYQQLAQNDQYMAAVKSIFDLASVIFLGYGLQDEYVLKLIGESLGEHELFGRGPHFLVKDLPGPPEDGVHRIAYRIALHPDHRAALTVLDFVQQAKSGPVWETSSAQPTPDRTGKGSSFYISDFRPSGTHIMGQTLELAMPGGEARMNATVGLGFVQGELPSNETVAFHDLAVGLICFDRVFLPLSSLGLLHERATYDVFWAMIDDGGIKFVDVIHDPFFICQPEAITGDIGIVRRQDPQMTETRSTMSVIRRMLQAGPGREVPRVCRRGGVEAGDSRPPGNK